uniref:Uncharacterized protein n=1 Tax=viral metagenome TaxID=1070528 RepID=A0A6C0L014_9ZZZZ|tara:strand:+ start:1760 stop:3085 length:1326 start_codon:yes stop_codon:yes gene_type:complete
MVFKEGTWQYKFIEFFVGVTLGYKAIEKKEDGTIFTGGDETIAESIFADPPSSEIQQALNIMRSEALTRRTKIRCKAIINRHTSMSTQTINSQQEIKVKCGTRPFYDYEYELRDVKYDFMGNKIEGSGCPQWGCCYDVLQTGEVNLVSINNTLLDQTTEIYNETTQEIKNQLNATFDMNIAEDDTAWYNSGFMSAAYFIPVVGQAAILTSALGNALATEEEVETVRQIARATNESQDMTKTKVENIIEKAIQQTVNTKDSIEVEYISPKLCINACGDPPTAGTIDQSLVIDALSENITKTILEEIERTIVNQSTSTETTASSVNMPMLYMFAFGTLVCLVVLFVICYAIVLILWTYMNKGEPPPSMINKVLALGLTVWCWCCCPIAMLCCLWRYSGIKGLLCIIPGHEPDRGTAEDEEGEDEGEDEDEDEGEDEDEDEATE